MDIEERKKKGARRKMYNQLSVEFKNNKGGWKVISWRQCR